MVLATPFPQPMLEGIQREISAKARIDSPPDNRAGEQIHHKSDVHESRPGRNIRNIGHPSSVRGRRAEVPVEAVTRMRGALRGPRRAHGAGVAHSGQSQGPHATLHGAPGDRLVRIPPAQDLPHLPRTEQATIRGMRVSNSFIPFRVRNAPFRGGTDFAPVIRTRSDLHTRSRQCATDRLDSEFVAVLVDERIDVFYRRSSSACAKNALAFRRISFALRSSRTSFSRSVIFCFSSVVVPAAPPESM